MGLATGEIEVEDGVLVIRRIHVRYELKAAAGADRARIARAFETHMPKCPIYRSLNRAIDLSTSLDVIQG